MRTQCENAITSYSPHTEGVRELGREGGSEGGMEGGRE